MYSPNVSVTNVRKKMATNKRYLCPSSSFLLSKHAPLRPSFINDFLLSSIVDMMSKIVSIFFFRCLSSFLLFCFLVHFCRISSENIHTFFDDHQLYHCFIFCILFIIQHFSKKEYFSYWLIFNNNLS